MARTCGESGGTESYTELPTNGRACPVAHDPAAVNLQRRGIERLLPRNGSITCPHDPEPRERRRTAEVEMATQSSAGRFSEPQRRALFEVDARSTALVVVAVCAAMYVLQWAQEVFIPIVLSVLISLALE